MQSLFLLKNLKLHLFLRFIVYFVVNLSLNFDLINFIDKMIDKNSLNIIHWNCNGIRFKIEELNNFLSKKKSKYFFLK